MHKCHSVMWWSKDSFHESVISFYRVGLGYVSLSCRSYSWNSNILGIGEIAQWLRVLATLSEDLGSTSSAHMLAYKPSLALLPGDLWPLRATYTHGAYRHTWSKTLLLVSIFCLLKLKSKIKHCNNTNPKRYWLDTYKLTNDNKKTVKHLCFL